MTRAQNSRQCRGHSGRCLSLIAGSCAVVTTGCASVDPQPQIDEAMELVQQHTGHRPGWSAPWDELPPEWDGQALLKLDAAIGLALRNNRELRADLESIGTANADLVQAGLMRNPVLNFMMMFPDAGGRVMLRSSALPMQPLQDLWLIPARKDVASAELRRAVMRMSDRAIELAAGVKANYARLQSLQQAIDLISDNLAVVEQSTRILLTRQATGQTTQVEANVSHIRELRLRSDRLAAQSQFRTLQRELLEQMGVATASDGWRVEALDPASASLDTPLDEASLLRLGLEQRLDVKAAEWGIDAAAARVTLMRREGWPDLALGLTLERPPAARTRSVGMPGRIGNRIAQGVADRLSGTAGPMAPMAAPFRVEQPEIDLMLGPMIEVEIPIFDQNQAQVARANHEFRRSVAEYEARAQIAARMIRAALVRHRESYDQLRLFRDSIVPEVQRNLELAQQSFVAGREDLTVYLLAQEDLIATRLRVLDFYRDYLVTRAELERAVGGRIGLISPTPAPETESGTVPAASERGGS